MNLPIYDKLKRYADANRIPFAMPGHKNGRGLEQLAVTAELDVTELDLTPDLIHHDESVREAEKLLTELYGTRQSRILTTGSTAAIHAMLLSVMKPHDTLITNRTAHMSVINACAMYGWRVVLMPQEIDREFMTARPISPETVARAVKMYPDASAVIITSPSYYGTCADIAAIAKIVHTSGMPLLVDEAHGAAFIASARLPEPAHKLGADITCESAHKTLNALNGAAYLHIMNDKAERIDEAIAAVCSSSPSYPIAASADFARAALAEPDNGWDKYIDRCEELKSRLTANTPARFMQNDDPTRLVLTLASAGIGGKQLAAELAAWGIDVEMSDDLSVVMIATPSNTPEDFSRLESAICDIYKKLGTSVPFTIQESDLFNTNEIVLCEPHKAFYSRDVKVNADEAAGRISRRTVMAYPPGVPIAAMGERITPEGAAVLGKYTDDGMIEVCEEL